MNESYDSKDDFNFTDRRISVENVCQPIPTH